MLTTASFPSSTLQKMKYRYISLLKNRKIEPLSDLFLKEISFQSNFKRFEGEHVPSETLDHN